MASPYLKNLARLTPGMNNVEEQRKQKDAVFSLTTPDVYQASQNYAKNAMTEMLLNHDNGEVLSAAENETFATIISNYWGLDKNLVKSDLPGFIEKYTGIKVGANWLQELGEYASTWEDNKRLSYYQFLMNMIDPESDAYKKYEQKSNDIVLAMSKKQKTFNNYGKIGTSIIEAAPTAMQLIDQLILTAGTAGMGAVAGGAMGAGALVNNGMLVSGGVGATLAGSTGAATTAGALTGAAVGQQLNLFHMDVVEAGGKAYEMRQMYKEDGTPMFTNEQIKIASTVYAAGIHLIEGYTDKFVDPIVKGMGLGKLSEPLKKFFEQNFITRLVGYGWDTLGQSAQEGIEGLWSSIVTDVATDLVSILNRENVNIDADRVKQEMKNAANSAWEDFSQSLVGFGVGGIPTAILSGMTGLNRIYFNPTQVNSQMSSDAKKYFTGGRPVDIRGIDTMGDTWSKESEESIADHQHHAIPVAYNEQTGLLVPVNASDRALVATLRESGATGVGVIFVDAKVNESVAQYHAAVIDDESDYVYGTSGNTILVKDEQGLKYVDEYFRSNSNTTAITQSEDGTTTYYVKSGNRSEGIKVKIGTQEMEEKPESVEPVRTYRDWASLQSERMSDNDPYSVDNYLRTEDERRAYEAINKALPESEKMSFNQRRELQFSKLGAARIMPIVSEITGMNTSDVLDKFVFTFDTTGKLKEANAYGGFEKIDGKLNVKIRIDKAVRPDTIMHEVIHGLRSLATSEQLAGFAEAYGGAVGGMWVEDIKKTDNGWVLGDKTYKTHDEALEAASKYEERFVDDFMRYLYGETGFNDAQKSFFAKVKQFFETFWADMRSILKDKLDPKTVKAFDILFGKDTPAQERADFVEVAATEGIKVATELASTGLEDETMSDKFYNEEIELERQKEAGEITEEEYNTKLEDLNNRKYEAMSSGPYYTLYQGYDWDRGMSNNAVNAYENGENAPRDNSILHQRIMDRNTQARIDADYEAVENALRADASNFDSEGNHLAPNGEKSNLTYKQWVQVRTPAFMDWFGDWLNDPENASKMIDTNGEPIVFYHGSDSDFDTFERSYIGTAHDSGFFGEGFYFAFHNFDNYHHNRDEASYYGHVVRAFFLNIRNPFNVREAFYGKGNSLFKSDLKAMLNVMKNYPEADWGSPSFWKDGELQDYTKEEMVSLIESKWDFAEKHSKIIEVEGDQGKEYFLRIERENPSYEWDYFSGFFEATREEVEKTKEQTIDRYVREELGLSDVPSSVRYYMEGTNFTDVIKQRGFDGIIQSMAGDEAVVFSPNQIKSATDNSGAFSTENNSTLYQRATDTEEFKNWFKDSKVVDENGSPLRVYHGTPEPGFTTFKESRDGLYYFTDSTDTASEFAREYTQGSSAFRNRLTGNEGGIYPVYLSMQNPLDFRSLTEEQIQKIADVASERFSIPRDRELENIRKMIEAGNHQGLKVDASSILENLSEYGFDGIIADMGIGGTEYAVVNPNQIKSVYNVGTFDSENDSFLYQKAEDKPMSMALDSESSSKDIRKLIGLDIDKKYTVDEILVALMDYYKKAFKGTDMTEKTDVVAKKIARVFAREVIERGKSMPDNNPIGWYSSEVEDALNVYKLVYPELAEERYQVPFLLCLAVASQGETVNSNSSLALKYYKYFKDHGVFPTSESIVKTSKGQAMRANFAKANTMLENSKDGTLSRSVLLSIAMAKDIEFMTGYKPSGESVNESLPMSVIFGPKIGGAFLANLLGDYSRFTMDKWMNRAYNRVTGSNRPSENVLAIGRRNEKLREAISEVGDVENMYDVDGNVFAKIFDSDKKPFSMQEVMEDDDVLFEWAKAVKKILAKQHTIDGSTQSFHTKLRTSLNMNAKNVAEGQMVKETFSSADRIFYRKIVREVQKILDREIEHIGRSHAIEIADIQAIMWYNEKNLYDKIESQASTSLGTTYSSAAAKSARAMGVSQESIQEALDDSRRERNERGIIQKDSGRAVSEQRSTESGLKVQRPGASVTGEVNNNRTRVSGRLYDIGSNGLREASDRGTAGSEGDVLDEGPGLPVRNIKIGDRKEVSIKNTYSPSLDFKRSVAFKKGVGVVLHTTYELDSTVEADFFVTKMKEAVKSRKSVGKQVEIKKANEYKNMRLFLLDTGKAGFALNGDEIVSVFSDASTKSSLYTIMPLAIKEGGRRLDCFDGFLPKSYSRFGARAVARTSFNREFAPKGWDYETMGEPDIVFMIFGDMSEEDLLNISYDSTYNPGDGQMADDYDQAEAIATQSVSSSGMLYQLSDEERAEALKARENDIREATQSGRWIRTEYIAEFAGQNWADNELYVRNWMTENPALWSELKDKARDTKSYEDFKEKLSKEVDAEGENKWGVGSWSEEDEALYKRLYQIAQLSTPQERNSSFIANHVMGDRELVKMAKTLREYSDLGWIEDPNRGDYANVLANVNRMDGVSNKVLKLNDKSTSAEIAEARQSVLKDTSAYRNAFNRATNRFNELDALDENLEGELDSYSEEQMNLERKANLSAEQTDWKKTAEELEKKLADAEADLEKLNKDNLTLEQAEDRLAKAREELKAYKAENKALKERQSDLSDIAWRKITEKNEEIRELKKIINAFRRREEARAAREDRKKMFKQIKKTLKIGKTTFGWNSNACDAKYLDAFSFLRGLFAGQDRSELIERRHQLISAIDELKTQNAAQDLIDNLEEELEDVRAEINGSEMKEVPAVLRPFTNALHLKADNRISKYTTEELSDILTIAKALKEQAKRVFAERYQALQSERSKNVSDYFEEIFGQDISDMDRAEIREAIASMQDKEFRFKIFKGLEMFRNWNSSTARLTRKLDGGKEGVLYNFFTRVARELYEEEQRNIQSRLEAGERKFSELGLKTTDLNKIMILHTETGKKGYTFMKENGEKVRLTVDQAIGVYIYGKNEDGLMKLRSAAGNGITEEAYYDIIAHLTSEQKAWGDWMMQELEGHWQRLSDIMYSVYNSSIGRVENYFTFKSDKKLDGKDEGMDIVTGSSGDTVRYVNKGFTKERVRAIYPLDLHVSRTWGNQVRKEEHFVAFAKWGRDANYYMDTDAGFGEVVEKKFGANNKSVLANYVEDMISPRSYTDEFDKALSTVIGRGASAMVAGNLSVMAKQLPTLASAIGNIGVKEFFSSVIARNVNLENFLKANQIMYENYEGARKFINDNSPVMKGRKYGSELIDNTAGIGRGNLDNATAKLNSKLMRATAGLTDSWVTSTLWLGMYMTTFNKLKAEATKNGTSFNIEEAHKEAVFKAGQLISETQNTSVPMDLSFMMRKAKAQPALKPLYLFSSTTMNMFNQLANDFPLYFKNRDIKGMAKVVLFVALNMAGMIAINGAIRKKKDEDDEEYAKRLKNEILSQFVNIAIPGFGSTFSSAIKGWSGNNSDISFVNDISSAIGKFANSSKNKTTWENFVDIMSALGYATAEGVGLPANASKKLIQSVVNGNPGYLINKTWGEIVEDNK